MRFTTHELTRNGWSGKNLCYLPRLAAQLTLYEKNGAFLTHWFAILAQSTLLENFSLRKSLLFSVAWPKNCAREKSPQVRVLVDIVTRDLLFYLCSPYLAPTIRE